MELHILEIIGLAGCVGVCIYGSIHAQLKKKRKARGARRQTSPEPFDKRIEL